MSETHKVGMADMKTCKSPDKLTTLGLGSCVGVILYDPSTKVSGMVHVMLPDSTKIKNNANIAKFADTGIKAIYDLIIKEGARPSNIVSKIAGGAAMFTVSSDSADIMKVGERNVEATKLNLKRMGIPILAEDTGLNYGRTIVFDSMTGELLIKAVGKEVKTI